MLRTYKAILHGDRLEWSEPPPATVAPNQPVAVHVTILNEAEASVTLSAGQRMAQALEQLAAINALPDVGDPVQWQRSLRQDRDVADRDE
ncbi:MAG: hypothetical protein ACT4QE_12585 [Anaerolineales bacterium]